MKGNSRQSLTKPTSDSCQGLILVHSSAQREHFVCDALGGHQVSVTKTAQDEVRSGRV